MENNSHNLGTGLTIITITVDDAERAPRIDLDNCPPHKALIIFSKALEALENVMPYPTITYAGEVISEDIYADLDEDDDGWG